MLRLNVQVEKVNGYLLLDLILDIVIDVLPPCRYRWVYIRQSTPLTIQRLPKPASEFSYVTASTSFTSTIDSHVLTHRSFIYVIKVICSSCDIIAIGNTSYGYELIWSQLSTNSFTSPRASESALSYTHRVRNSLTILANDKILNVTPVYWSQTYSDLQRSTFAIYSTEGIPHHSRPTNPMSYLPRYRKYGRNKGWIV